MRFSAPCVSKAVAAVALMAVGTLIAVSLMADAGRASAWMEDRSVHLREDDAADDEPKGYKFNVAVSDGSARDSVEATATVTERTTTDTDDHDSDELATGSNFEIEENKTAAAGETLIRVGKVAIVPAGSHDALDTNYVLVNFREEFQLNPSGRDSGANKNVLWATGPFNHEEDDEFQLTVSSEGTYPAPTGIFMTVNVTVLDVNEHPFFVRHDLDSMSDQQAINYCLRDDIAALRLTNPPIIRINENAAIGSVIADYDACDPDEGDNVRFTISGLADSAYFDIHSGTGQLSVDGSLDYELKPAYTIEVEVSDSEFTYHVDQRIYLNDINENITPTPTRTAAPTPIPTRTAAPPHSPLGITLGNSHPYAHGGASSTSSRLTSQTLPSLRARRRLPPRPPRRRGVAIKMCCIGLGRWSSSWRGCKRSSSRCRA